MFIICIILAELIRLIKKCVNFIFDYELKDKKGGTILIHREDAEGLFNENLSLTYYIGMDTNFESDSRLQDNDLIHLGDLEFKVIHTPGHTKGGSSLYCESEEFVLTGDTLFRGTWGRTDLPTSSFEEIISSILASSLVPFAAATICLSASLVM